LIVFFIPSQSNNGGVAMILLRAGKRMRSIATITLSDGSKCEGDIINGILHGQAQCNYINKGRYSGNFEDGKFDGLGIYTFADGSTYIGEFKAG
jgi:hypothetical protein